MHHAQGEAAPPPRDEPAPPREAGADGWAEDLNRVELTGWLAREPRLRDVGDHPLAELELVSACRWVLAPGIVMRVHRWHRLTAWEELAHTCGRLLHAGDRVFVAGTLRPITGLVAGVPTTTDELVLEQIILLARAPAAGPVGTPADPAIRPWPEHPW